MVHWCFHAGEIPWSDNLYVQSKSATAFDVVTVSLVVVRSVASLMDSLAVILPQPNRVYHLNDLVNGSKKWVEAINAALVRAM
jgi:hypothetical protein